MDISLYIGVPVRKEILLPVVFVAFVLVLAGNALRVLHFSAFHLYQKQIYQEHNIIHDSEQYIIIYHEEPEQKFRNHPSCIRCK